MTLHCITDGLCTKAYERQVPMASRWFAAARPISTGELRMKTMRFLRAERRGLWMSITIVGMSVDARSAAVGSESGMETMKPSYPSLRAAFIRVGVNSAAVRTSVMSQSRSSPRNLKMPLSFSCPAIPAIRSAMKTFFRMTDSIAQSLPKR